MKDIPILFSGPMVRALLEGRKTMTRRVLNPQPEHAVDSDGVALPYGIMHVEGDRRPRVTVGRVITRQELRWAVGDRLWVRESVWLPEGRNPHGHVTYRADHGADQAFIWTPSIHMPRWASRLTLIVMATNLEPLQDISAADARAEGCPEPFYGGEVQWFTDLWCGINGEASWDANPVVVAISGNVIKANIDSMPKAVAA